VIFLPFSAYFRLKIMVLAHKILILSGEVVLQKALNQGCLQSQENIENRPFKR